MRRRLRKRISRAFTIIELAVVMAVASIIAAIVLPDFIETARNDLAEQTGVQMAELMGSARQFFHTTGLQASDPFFARWPGEADMAPAGPNCSAGVDGADVELVDERLVRMGDLSNPWQKPYYFTLQGARGASQPFPCRFIISTDVPQQISLALTAQLPGAACNAAGGGGGGGGNRCPNIGQKPPPNFQRCCFGSPRPGVEASLTRMEIEATTVMCASFDTPIATPSGARAISELRVGDLVYSEESDAIVAVPLLEVNSHPVSGHAMVQLTLADGNIVEMSASHPTADGRRFDELVTGDRLGDALIVSVSTVPYLGQATWDILPDSATGAYFAAGALVGSTLLR